MAEVPILSLGQVKLGLDVYAKAAKLLLDACPGQASARAYYQVHFVAQQIAAALSLVNPIAQTQPGGKLRHANVPYVVAQICESQVDRGQILPITLTSDKAFAYADGLLKARMEADYRPHQAFSRERAQKLLVYADTLKGVLLLEVQFMRAQAKTRQGGTS